MKATAIANSNIAFIKYWGKKDQVKNIPMNPSISMTLDDNFSTKTTVEFSDKYTNDILILNNKKQIGNKFERVSIFLDIIRKKSNIELKAKVVSVNTFPTASGIASSASGFAALAAASCKALNLEISQNELSGLARQGSGSACRSVYGGFVEWKNESAVQLQNENFWPELRDVVVILSNEEKPISSREAMKLSVEKSKLYQDRIKNIQNPIRLVKSAILKKNFEKLARHIMKDSDSMHECIEETGIKYLNESSLKIKEIICALNKNKIKAAYTFDAGPNAHIITLSKYLDDIKDALKKIQYQKVFISQAGKGIRYTDNHLF